jgi:N-acetylmuramoyl-L-alanine amidase
MLLRQGVNNAKVQELQRLLKTHNFWPHAEFSNNFGPKTHAAVLAFQKANKLKDDGVVGPATWRVLASRPSIVVVPALVADNNSVADKEDVDLILNLPEVTVVAPTSKRYSELVKLIAELKFTRKVDTVVYHCTASRQTATVQQIIDYHLKTLKWSRPGYHILIDARGEWTYVHPFNSPSNGVANINSRIVNICYIGGIDASNKPIDNRTDEQKATMEVIQRAFARFHPTLKHEGHYKYANKACPSFKVDKWIETLPKI